ncbi:hypothetical protein OV203_01460 [Nannocystis sp. ILAH1]|uniref:hypothetical protein n=1 Tax=Nannocystis sp. ILAH1 TaxID=2996789 RepID=UPI0022706423|nr:hypothetical protein [Nannocystis sp. ILAH1]MCY0985778.1 hypothetical protein [Nannocystis sp. ILAH1]
MNDQKKKSPPPPVDLSAFFVGCVVVGAGLGLAWYLWPTSHNAYARPIPRL